METNQLDQTTTTDIAPPSDMPARYSELTQLVSSMESDFRKFFIQGNKAAGTRVRKAMQELKTFAQAVRTEVQSLKNSEPS
jgi:hypothetical protein